MSDPLKPSPALLSKLGSVIVRQLEAGAAGGHPFDITALEQLLKDPEVIEWMRGMGELALLPARR
jgi:hypothetical protein